MNTAISTHLDSSSILLSIQDIFCSLLQMLILFSLSAIIHVVFQLKIQVLFLFSTQDVAFQHQLSSLEAEYWFKNASSSLLSFSSILSSTMKSQVFFQLLVHLHFSIQIQTPVMMIFSFKCFYHSCFKFRSPSWFPTFLPTLIHVIHLISLNFSDG